MNSRPDWMKTIDALWAEAIEGVTYDYKIRIEMQNVPEPNLSKFENDVCEILLALAVSRTSFLDEIYGETFIENVKDAISEVRRGESPIIQRMINSAYEKLIKSVNHELINDVSIQ